MLEFHQKFPFNFVIMLGDNIYGGSSPADLKKKFETPYMPLLDAGVQFYASLGNHDDTNERFYKFFNMNGQQYYSFKKAMSNSLLWIAITWIRSSWLGSKKNSPMPEQTGRSVIFIIPSTLPERFMVLRRNYARCWNPCS